MSSAVETSLKRFLHSLRSVEKTVGVNIYTYIFCEDIKCNRSCTLKIDNKTDVFGNMFRHSLPWSFFGILPGSCRLLS